MKNARALMLLATLLVQAIPAYSEAASTLPENLRPFVAVTEPSVALRHVRVIDGTGAPPTEDQTVLLKDGRISAVGPERSTPIPSGYKILDL